MRACLNLCPLYIVLDLTQVCVQVASPGTLIVVFTDNGSKDLFLEREVIKLREKKQCEVYIVLTPAFEGRITGKSLPAYGRMGQVRNFNLFWRLGTS